MSDGLKHTLLLKPLSHSSFRRWEGERQGGEGCAGHFVYGERIIRVILSLLFRDHAEEAGPKEML